MEWDLIVERKIEAARNEGAFDDLPGSGRPLKLRTNPFVDKDWQLAFDILQKAGFAPRWIELDQEIREKLDRARVSLKEHNHLRSDSARSSVERRFKHDIQEINKLIKLFNLLVPATRFGRTVIDAESELATLSRDHPSVTG